MSNVSLSVRDHMSNRLATLREKQDIREAVKIFTERNLFGGAVVDNRGNLVGILSVTDCIDVALRTGYHSGWRGTVGDRMSRDIRTVDADDNILDVAEMFMNDHYRLGQGRDVRQHHGFCRLDVSGAFAVENQFLIKSCFHLSIPLFSQPKPKIHTLHKRGHDTYQLSCSDTPAFQEIPHLQSR